MLLIESGVHQQIFRGIISPSWHTLKIEFTKISCSFHHNVRCTYIEILYIALNAIYTFVSLRQNHKQQQRQQQKHFLIQIFMVTSAYLKEKTKKSLLSHPFFNAKICCSVCKFVYFVLCMELYTKHYSRYVHSRLSNLCNRVYYRTARMVKKRRCFFLLLSRWMNECRNKQQKINYLLLMLICMYYDPFLHHLP